MTEVLAPTAPTSSSTSASAVMSRTESPEPMVNHATRPREPRPQARERVPSYAQNRMSSFSGKTSRSRPQSNTFPTFQSGLSHTLVRDFAYPAFHAMHYGSPPDPPSGSTTPGSEWNTGRRSSDPMEAAGRGNWTAGPWGGDGVLFDGGMLDSVDPLPSTIFGNDEAHSDEQMRRKHRKSKSYDDIAAFDRGRRRESGTRDVQYEQRDLAGRDSLRHSRNYGHPHAENIGGGGRDARQTSHGPTKTFPFAQTIDLDSDMPLDREIPTSPSHSPTANRQSLGPDDEELFAGESLALYSFEPENANELRLVEGQHILVSYRHGQGWLVAEDKVTGEQGLVPEAYVRLISEIPNYDPVHKRFLPMDDDEDDDVMDHEASGEASGLAEGTEHLQLQSTTDQDDTTEANKR